MRRVCLWLQTQLGVHSLHNPRLCLCVMSIFQKMTLFCNPPPKKNYRLMDLREVLKRERVLFKRDNKLIYAEAESDLKPVCLARRFPFWEGRTTHICRSNSVLSSFIKNVVAVPCTPLLQLARSGVWDSRSRPSAHVRHARVLFGMTSRSPGLVRDKAE